MTDRIDHLPAAQSNANGVNGADNTCGAGQPDSDKRDLRGLTGLAAVVQNTPKSNSEFDADVAIEHWHDLFHSVKFRLRSTVDIHLAALTRPWPTLPPVRSARA